MSTHRSLRPSEPLRAARRLRVGAHPARFAITADSGSWRMCWCLLAALFLSFGCSPTPASPAPADANTTLSDPTRPLHGVDDADLDAAIRRYEAGRVGFPRPDPRVAASLAGIPVERLTAAQLERLGVMLDLGDGDIRSALTQRLMTLARARDAEGARAAVLLPRMLDMPSESATPEEAKAFDATRAGLIADAVRHPGFRDALRQGRATAAYWWTYFYLQNDALVAANTVDTLIAGLEDPKVLLAWNVGNVNDLAAFAEAAIDPNAGLSRTKVDRIRSLTSEVLHRIVADDAVDGETRDGLLNVLAMINSASASGQLEGSPAPPLTFRWTNAPGAPARLADLRGRVVVLDFWATWCGPCIASFPETRALEAAFRGRPVTILGVTSLQGWIQTPKRPDEPSRRITGLGPEAELTMLASWVKEMDMTWPVAVMESDLFNHDYGVTGVPTVIVIDAEGVVRHANLRPTDPTLAEKIEAVLQKTGAPTSGDARTSGSAPPAPP